MSTFIRFAIVLTLCVPLPSCSFNQERIAKSAKIAQRACEVLNASVYWTRLPSDVDKGAFILRETKKRIDLNDASM